MDPKEVAKGSGTGGGNTKEVAKGSSTGTESVPTLSDAVLSAVPRERTYVSKGTESTPALSELTRGLKPNTVTPEGAERTGAIPIYRGSPADRAGYSRKG